MSFLEYLTGIETCIVNYFTITNKTFLEYLTGIETFANCPDHSHNNTCKFLEYLTGIETEDGEANSNAFVCSF